MTDYFIVKPLDALLEKWWTRVSNGFSSSLMSPVHYRYFKYTCVVLLVGGGVLVVRRLVISSRWYFLYNFSSRTKNKLIPPNCYPTYVEKISTIQNLRKEINNGLGVIVFWGPPDSGKSSYAIRCCNEMLENNELGGIIQVHGSTFVDEHDNGAKWLNHALNLNNILKSNNYISNLFPYKGEGASFVDKLLSYWLYHNKRVVFLVDQFDRFCEHSNIDSVCRFIRTVAEDAVKFDTYCVLLCVSDKDTAAQILGLNDGRKIRLLQQPNELKWGEEEISQYFNKANRILTEEERIAAINGGTPGICVDLFQGREKDTFKNTAKKVASQWEITGPLRSYCGYEN
jgi:hypothetical protein